MRARLQTVLEKLASLLWSLGEPLLYCLWVLRDRWPKQAGWVWPMVHNQKWQQSTGLNLFIFPVSILALHFGVKQVGHGLMLTVGSGCVFDLVSYPVFRKEAKTSASGGRSLIVSGFFFLFHKVLAFVFFLMCGFGVIETRLALGGVGILENPVVFVIRKDFIFTKAGFRESLAAGQRLEMARAMATEHLTRFRIGV